MRKFRKKPVVIEAEQFFPDNKYWPPYIRRFTDPDDPRPCIHTLEGIMFVSPGDWIIKGVKGEFYPCKPDIFELTYEEVEEYHEDVI